MNRKQRRQAGIEGGQVGIESGDKCTVVLHQHPEDIGPTLLALLQCQLVHAFDLGSKLPGVTFPIHVVVEYGGKRACGFVSPATGTASSTAVDPNVH